MNSIPHLPFEKISLIAPPRIYVGEPGWKWTAVIAGYYNLWIALDGYGYISLDHVEYPIQPGCAFIIRPGQRVEASHKPETPIRNLAIHFTPDPDTKAIQKAFNALLPERVKVHNKVRLSELSKASVQASRYSDGLADQQMRGLSFQILTQVIRDGYTQELPQTDARLLDQMERMIEQPFHWQSVQDLSTEASLSIPQYNRRFKALAKESPTQFAIKHRIQRACELLQHSPLQVSEISEALGYNDVYYFSRQFKAFTNLSPTHYRRAHLSHPNPQRI